MQYTNHKNIVKSLFMQYTNHKKIKIKLRSLKSSEHNNEKWGGPYYGFGHLSLFSDPLDLARNAVILQLSSG